MARGGATHDEPAAAGEHLLEVQAWLSARGITPPPAPPVAAGMRSGETLADGAGPTDHAARSDREDDESGADPPSGASARRSRAGRSQRGRSGNGRSVKRSGDPGALDSRAPAPPDEAEADPEAVARSIALRRLAAQARTRHELERALAAKDVPPEVAERVLDQLSDVGLIDDTAFAADWVTSRQQRRHLSAGALKRELTAKGVDRDEASAAVAAVTDEDEYAAALNLAERRQRPMMTLPRDVRYRRLAGVLSRRGFSPAVTSRVLREVLHGDPDDESGAYGG